ncbi:MAG: SPOR domain-containing protein [Massilia sp.]|nr:SPOR domain-containing protein [Massilia sp.]
MGLFSFLNKNKQEATAHDRGYYSRDDDSGATRARSKRASSAGDPAPERLGKSRVSDDPVLPEKKRARRRLVGAVALALAVAVGLPMVLDSEPKPLASDIVVQIPSRDKAAPLPLPVAPGEAPAALPADSLDQREQFVEPARAQPREPAPPAAPLALPVPAPAQIAAPVRQVESKAVESKAVESKAVAPKAIDLKAMDSKIAEPKPSVKPVARAEDKVALKSVPAAPEASRALAILEGKVDRARAPDVSGPKFVVQVAALATQEKVAELQDKLRQAGISSQTHKVSTGAGERIIQVQVGPFSRDEADRMRAKIEQAGLKGSMVKPDGT